MGACKQGEKPLLCESNSRGRSREPGVWLRGGEFMTPVREATRSEDAIDVAKRLKPYIDTPHSRGADAPDRGAHQASPTLDDLMERAATLVAVMPPHQRRATIEELVCPHDPRRGQRAIDALIEGALVAEDERGCLRLLR